MNNNSACDSPKTVFCGMSQKLWICPKGFHRTA